MSRAVVLLAFVGTLAAACGGGSSGGSPTTSTSAQPDGSNVAGATTAVKALYAQFFQAPEAQAVTLLQDGSSLTKAIQIANKIKGKATESAKVSKVTFTDPDDATVVYALSSNGNVVLPSATGNAVYVDGKWLFAKTTFCTLVGLGYTKPIPNC